MATSALGIRALYDDYKQDGDAVLRLTAQEERIPAVREMIDSGRAYHRAWVACVRAAARWSDEGRARATARRADRGDRPGLEAPAQGTWDSVASSRRERAEMVTALKGAE